MKINSPTLVILMENWHSIDFSVTHLTSCEVLLIHVHISSLHRLFLFPLSEIFENESGFRRYGFGKTFEVIRKRNFNNNESESREGDPGSDEGWICRTEKGLVWELGAGEGEDTVSPRIYYVRDFDKMIQPSEHLMHIYQLRCCW